MGRNRLGKQYHVGRKFKILSQVENTDFSIPGRYEQRKCQ